MSQQAPEGPTRLERDSMGELQVPAGAYYGATSQRAQLNFPISDLRFNRSFIKAIGQIKQAASRVNRDLDALEPALADAIDSAAQKVIDGEYDDQFVVDIFQTGSGTSTNMNANEVISNVAIKALGGEIGSRSPVHPNDHVNKGQSSNDVIPTAIHLAAAGAIRERLLPAMAELEGELRKKSEEFWPVIKTGRTHLQDATPIRLGQEFSGYVGQMEYGRQRVESALAELSVLAIGGTAVGT
ncbi:MAG: aspartate ammonia-lyase, partial [Chloroflexi bacterium]|nr:aspartate ammonia-lyase [Chloroflexota bacterium]